MIQQFPFQRDNWKQLFDVAISQHMTFNVLTNKCIRLYNEDIAVLFRDVRVGTPGEFLYQPVKIGSRGGEIYAEIHPDIYSLRGNLEEEADRIVARKGWTERIDRARLQKAIKDQTGVPISISSAGRPEQVEPAE